MKSSERSRSSKAILPKRSARRGQGLVEFALILPILLLTIMTLIELARVLQAWLSIENGARFGVRYAVTGEYDTQYCENGAAAADLAAANGNPALAVEYIAHDLDDGVQDCVVPSTATSDYQSETDGLKDFARIYSIHNVARASALAILLYP